MPAAPVCAWAETDQGFRSTSTQLSLWRLSLWRSCPLYAWRLTEPRERAHPRAIRTRSDGSLGARDDERVMRVGWRRLGLVRGPDRCDAVLQIEGKHADCQYMRAKVFSSAHYQSIDGTVSDAMVS